MAAWRELWRYLLTLPDGPVPERVPEPEPPAEREDALAARTRATGRGGRRPR